MLRNDGRVLNLSSSWLQLYSDLIYHYGLASIFFFTQQLLAPLIYLLNLFSSCNIMCHAYNNLLQTLGGQPPAQNNILSYSMPVLVKHSCIPFFPI